MDKLYSYKKLSILEDGNCFPLNYILLRIVTSVRFSYNVLISGKSFLLIDGVLQLSQWNNFLS